MADECDDLNESCGMEADQDEQAELEALEFDLDDVPAHHKSGFVAVIGQP
ncbi:MAG: hypothetical protein GX601_19065, partial [Anaerolineales bacterium]|nr:hypothetical protein [Anaerolineales bacterium]